MQEGGSDFIRVLLVDDSPQLCAAWSRLLQGIPDVNLVGAIHRADTLPRAVVELKPHVVLLDASMQGRDPLDVVAELADTWPDVKIVIYTGRSEFELMNRARLAGAAGFVSKGEEPRTVLNVLRRIHAGEYIFPDDQ